MKIWDDSIQVLVIGTGIAGLSAAIEAHNAGASVLVLDKMKGPGGNSLISDGGIAAAGTDEQSDAGIEDSADLMYRDMMKAGLGINHPDLVRTLCHNSKEAYEWSKNYLGVKYLDRLDIFGGHSVKRCFTAEKVSGVSIIKKLMEKIRSLSIPVRFQTNFRNFLFDDHGRICGALVQEAYDFKKNEGRAKRRIKADAIILATGGFASDVTFRMTQDPRLDESVQSTTQPFSNSQALRTALKAGASPVQLSHIQLGPWASPDETGYGDGPYFSEYILFQMGILIDPDNGKRFVNELGDRKSLSDRILETGHPSIGIADSVAVKESRWNIDKCLKKQVVRTFDSIDSLAEAYNVDKVQLGKTIDQFNGYVFQKKDPDYNKPILKEAKGILEAPFYAIRLWPKVHHTMGGLNIDKNAQVLDLHGDPVLGLFAAGEVAGGVHGASRLGSCAITECFVFGRIAGRTAASYTSI